MACICVEHHFNSIKIQLKRKAMKAVLTLDKFQFHKDTIKARKPPSHSNALPNFNSIKVQLKPSLTLPLTITSLISIP